MSRCTRGSSGGGCGWVVRFIRGGRRGEGGEKMRGTPAAGGRRLSPRRPGVYPRRLYRDIRLASWNAALLLLLSAAAIIKRWLPVGVERSEIGGLSYLRVRGPGVDMVVAIWVSLQDKLRPRDVNRLFSLFERLPAARELVLLVVAPRASATAEEMLEQWMGAAPRSRLVVWAPELLLVKRRALEEGVIDEELIRRVLKPAVDRIVTFIRSRLEAARRRLREMVEKGRLVGEGFAKLVATLATMYGIITGVIDRLEATLALMEFTDRLRYRTYIPAHLVYELVSRLAPPPT